MNSKNNYKNNLIIDVRSLLHIKPCGVRTYVLSLVEEILKDKTLNIVLYSNSFLHKGNIPNQWLAKSNVSLSFTKIPNKLLNISMSFFNFPKIDSLASNNIAPNIPIYYFVPDLLPYAVSKDVKVLQTIHDLSFIKYGQYFNLKTNLIFKLFNYKKNISKASKLLAVSGSVKTELKSLRINQNIEVIECGAPRASVNNGGSVKVKGKKYFLIISTIEPRKNMRTMIDAFIVFNKEHPDYKLYIIGEKNNNIFANYTISEKEKINSNIIFLGNVSEIDKSMYLKNAKALLYVSYYEGFGLPIVEALAKGTMVITSDSGAMKEKECSNVLLANPNSALSIVSAMKKIRRLVFNDRDIGIKKYNWRLSSNKLLSLLYKEKN